MATPCLSRLSRATAQARRLRIADVIGSPCRQVVSREPQAEEVDDCLDSLQNDSDGRAHCGIKARMLDPLPDRSPNTVGFLAIVFVNLLQDLLPAFSTDTRLVGELPCKPPPGERRDRAHRMGQELQEPVEVERFPENFDCQRQHLQGRTKGAGFAKALPRAVGRDHQAVEQCALAGRHQKPVPLHPTDAVRQPSTGQEQRFALDDGDAAVILPVDRAGFLASQHLQQLALEFPQSAFALDARLWIQPFDRKPRPEFLASAAETHPSDR